MTDLYVLDASMGLRDGLACFCPVELDADGNIASVIVGMNYLSDAPPAGGKLIAIVHDEGQDAVEAFCSANSAFLDALRGRLSND